LLNQKLYHKKYTKNIKTFDNVAFVAENNQAHLLRFSVLSKLSFENYPI